jgi:hypothetical protein
MKRPRDLPRPSLSLLLVAGIALTVGLVAVVFGTSVLGGDDSSRSSASAPPISQLAMNVPDGKPEKVRQGMKDPINFEVFSAGPAPAGLPLTGASRRCDPATPAGYGWPNNYVNYSYGTCKIAKNTTGCSPPLTIQTWPACQRSESSYAIEGHPLPHRELPSLGGAKVVEFTFPSERIEVYTKSSTIVIFYADRRLAQRALHLLRSQRPGKKPARDAAALTGDPAEQLAPPVTGSTKGDLPCQS